MKYLILSDIHSNLEALEAVLSHAEPVEYEKSVMLGDLVGYCANPEEVIRRVRELPGLSIIRGNHDKVVSGNDSGEEFNELAIASCKWTQEHLSEESIAYLRSLPTGPVEVDKDFFIAHGTPLAEDDYILSKFDAAEVFEFHSSSICFFGHSHIPLVFILKPGNRIEYYCPSGEEEEFHLSEDNRYLINFGSVGQPRDRDPKAAYGVFDSQTRIVYFYRVSYPIAETQKKIIHAKLPGFLAERLIWGA